jgi:hypothetical protein
MLHRARSVVIESLRQRCASFIRRACNLRQIEAPLVFRDSVAPNTSAGNLQIARYFYDTEEDNNVSPIDALGVTIFVIAGLGKEGKIRRLRTRNRAQ